MVKGIQMDHAKTARKMFIKTCVELCSDGMAYKQTSKPAFLGVLTTSFRLE